jgi:peptidoglycan hydrolase-like protein with peptidoglycan-binding domain
VAILQFQLNKFGYKLPIDFNFGMVTEKAVRDFQLTKKLLADGIVGAKTWDKLYNI